MSTSYVTKDLDMLDAICWTQYAGQQEGAVEAVLAANTWLSQYDEELPAGLVIALPDRVPPPQPAAVITRFWE